MAASAVGSSPAGTGKPASLISFARRSCRTLGGKESPARLRSNRKLNAFTITIPRTAIDYPCDPRHCIVDSGSRADTVFLC